LARKKTNTTDPLLFDVRVTTAPCVLAIREKVGHWRDGSYKGATDTTRRLLQYWFHTDHRLANGRKFAYHWSQQCAVETLIYLFEIAKVRNQKGLIETYAHVKELKLLQFDDFARYCVKMATCRSRKRHPALSRPVWIGAEASAQDQEQAPGLAGGESSEAGRQQSAKWRAERMGMGRAAGLVPRDVLQRARLSPQRSGEGHLDFRSVEHDERPDSERQTE
jgi:hypothetical protein